MSVLSLLVYAFVASFTPGPNNIMSLYFANQFGLKHTFRFCVGVGIGFFILLSIANYFTVALNTVFPQVEYIMKLFGCLYLLYLAFKIMKSKLGKEQQFNSRYNNMKSGAMLQFINPKGTVYAITVTATFVAPFYHHYLSQFLFVILLAVIGFLGTFSWSLFGSLFKKWIAQYQKVFNITMALLLVYTAATILFH
ncbi:MULTISPECIES: LysE family translocator [Fictibacillus]|uniref:Lysine transporter LysE n=1 Tax=Fictibacillus enclensis TaxID=1017270 RepID=A0A0V8J608_9BACL|nr:MULTISPECIES: LysE family transporter [Fictibacillus]KSU82112.1 lysine transporter LysE [Fictibacillus enclensis]RXZ01546.1 lysine transporter LysE [Fictibacillus sp. S7]SCC30463.1 Threonine/homoserine/homoserine lactone efflux protein [Fictibacillus enclensis]